MNIKIKIRYKLAIFKRICIMLQTIANQNFVKSVRVDDIRINQTMKIQTQPMKFLLTYFYAYLLRTLQIVFIENLL